MVGTCEGGRRGETLLTIKRWLDRRVTFDRRLKRAPDALVLFLQGVHPVMEILGHRDLNTTMRIDGHVVDQM